MYATLFALWAAVMLFFVGCGEDGDGNDDALLTGFSGLVIAIIVVWLIVRAIRKSR